MFTGNRAAPLDAETENVAAELLGPFQLIRIVGIVKDQGVEIAVTGVKHVGDLQTIFSGELTNSSQDLGQFPTWNRAVHAVVIRRNSANGGKSRFPPLPELHSLFFRRCLK